MRNGNENSHYSIVAIWLHWIIAVLLIAMMGVGIWMTGAIKAKETQSIAFDVYQIHKSFGIVILVLSVIRLLWRLSHKAPDMPVSLAKWEKLAAHSTHFIFYVMMLALPITGWLMVSASPWGLPTIIFGTAELPHLSVLSELDQAGKILWEERFKNIHNYMAFGGIGLICLHVSAALKHHFIIRDDSLIRIAPFIEKYKAKD